MLNRSGLAVIALLSTGLVLRFFSGLATDAAWSSATRFDIWIKMWTNETDERKKERLRCEDVNVVVKDDNGEKRWWKRDVREARKETSFENEVKSEWLTFEGRSKVNEQKLKTLLQLRNNQPQDTTTSLNIVRSLAHLFQQQSIYLLKLSRTILDHQSSLFQ